MIASRSIAACGVVLLAVPLARAESPPAKLDAALRGGVLSSTNYDVSAGGLIEGEAAYRFAPAWRAGGYLGWATVRSTSSVDTTQRFEAVRFGARGAWHARADRLLDPWAGVSFGALCTTGTLSGRLGAEVGFDLGLDVRVAPAVVIGPVFALSIPLGNGQLHPWTTPVGAYFSGVPLSVPVPFLRVAVAF